MLRSTLSRSRSLSRLTSHSLSPPFTSSSHLLRSSSSFFLTSSRTKYRLFSSTPVSQQPSPTPLTSQIYRIQFNSPPPPPNPHERGRLPGPSKKPRGRRSNLVLITLIAGGIYYVAHLEKVPETDRWRFMNVSPEYEAKFASTLRSSMKSELASKTLPPNHPISLHVQRVVTRLLSASSLGSLSTPSPPSPHSSSFDGDIMGGLGALFETQSIAGNKKDVAGGKMNSVYGKEKKWDVIVVNDPRVVNAMASPGLIVVFTGILPVCQDEEGLAAVLAHEIGHVVARHTAERLSSQTIAFTALILLQFVGLNFGLSDLIQRIVLELPNSRKQELEADLIGLRVMSRGCYDPAASPRMFERLAKLENKAASTLSFLGTHPSSESRVRYLNSHLPEAYSVFDSNPECARMRGELERFRESAGANKGVVWVGRDGEVR
ncbi:peptidase family M48-domain-containing protein [Panaeolus papilionaceus]|nr:peptidase family M48-domain-containing protein [Panaeolus papilionaceus]